WATARLGRGRRRPAKSLGERGALTPAASAARITVLRKGPRPGFQNIADPSAEAGRQGNGVGVEVGVGVGASRSTGAAVTAVTAVTAAAATAASSAPPAGAPGREGVPVPLEGGGASLTPTP
ncbi:unnamed protein product, partial [Discosporangium mesarthrocarpum]